MKECSECGTENSEEAEFCKECGNNLENIPSSLRSSKDNSESGEKRSFHEWLKWGIVGFIIFAVTITSVFYIFELGRFSPEEEVSANLSAEWIGRRVLTGAPVLETKIRLDNPTENDIRIFGVELEEKFQGEDEWSSVGPASLEAQIFEVKAGNEKVIYHDNLDMTALELSSEVKFRAVLHASRGRIVTNIVKPEGGGCFIATAAYGTKKDKRLRPLRNLRDDVLLTNDFGKTVVNAYYDTSPPIADAMRNNDLVRSAAKYSMVIPASTTAGILMNGMGLLLVLVGVIGLLLLSYSYGKLTAVLKVISASILTLALGIVLILSLGWASYLWAGFATIAAYILPLVFPAVIVTSAWVLKRNL